eukprot:UN14675
MAAVAKSRDAFNSDFRSWAVEDVALWISTIEDGAFSSYSSAFVEQKCDGNDLTELEANDLFSFGIKILKDRKKIMKHIHKLALGDEEMTG